LPAKPHVADFSPSYKGDVCTIPARTAKGLGLLREAFAFVDIDNNGALSPGELTARVLKLSDTRMTNEDITKMIK